MYSQSASVIKSVLTPQSARSRPLLSAFKACRVHGGGNGSRVHRKSGKGGASNKNTQYFTIYPSSVRGGNRRLGLLVHTGAHHFFSPFHVLAYFRMSSLTGRFKHVQKLFIAKMFFLFLSLRLSLDLSLCLLQWEAYRIVGLYLPSSLSAINGF